MLLIVHQIQERKLINNKDNSIKAKASSGSELAQDSITDTTVVSNAMTIRKTKPTLLRLVELFWSFN
jgi:hypothetical protein